MYRFIPSIIIFVSILIFIYVQFLKLKFAEAETVYIQTIQGDKKALDDVEITGNIFDPHFRVEFNIKSNNISKKFFKAPTSEQFNKLYEDRDYFNQNYNDIDYNIYTDIIPHENSNIISKKDIDMSENIYYSNNPNFKCYKYRVDKIQPILNISENSDGLPPLSSIDKHTFIIPDCYIYSDIGIEFYKDVNFYPKTDRIYSVLFYEDSENLSEYSNGMHDSIRYKATVNDNAYFTVVTDSNYRGNSGIYKLENISEVKLNDYITERERKDLEKLKNIENILNSDCRKLADIDLKDGNRCVYGISAIGNYLATIIYEFKSDNTVEYQLWIFDPSTERFLHKLPLTAFEKSNIKSSESSNISSKKLSYIYDYCDVKLYIQKDYLNLVFLYDDEHIRLITVKIQDDSISVVNIIDTDRIGIIVNLMYKNGKTYVQFNSVSDGNDLVLDIEKKWMEYSEAKIMYSPKSIIEVFDGSQNIYSGQIMTNIYQDIINVYTNYSYRTISTVDFK